MQDGDGRIRKEFANGDPPDDIAPDGSLVFFREQRATCASLVEIVLPPGGRSRTVRHRTVEEIWYFLEGTGSVTVDGVSRHVSVGSTAVIPTGRPFGFENTSEVEVLRFLCYTSPPWPGPGEAVVEPPAGGSPNWPSAVPDVDRVPVMPESPERTSEEKEREFRERDRKEDNGVEQASKESFPASDPPAIPDPKDP